MNIEDRLRDAYCGATETVRPDAIRELDEHAFTICPPGERPGGIAPRRAPRRLMIPLAAASAVALVGVLTTVVVPRVLAGHRPPAAASPAGKFIVTVNSRGSTLIIRNARTGADVAAIASPARSLYFSGLATGDGRHYVAELWRSGVCRTWLYQFTLTSAGRPGRRTPYALPQVSQLLTPIAVSADNSTFGYLGERCGHQAGPSSSDLAVVNLATKRTSSWSIPKQADVSSLSLTAHGGMLAYNISASKLFRSAAYVLPAGAPAGPAAQRSRLVANGTQFGRGTSINSDVISPDGSRLYFTTYRTGSRADDRWQLRVADLATGRSRVLAGFPGLPVYLSAGPSVHRALVIVRGLLLPTPSPSPAGPTPSRSPAGPTPSPAGPTPSRSPTGPTPSPSPSSSPRGLPAPARSPAPSAPVTRPAGTPTAEQLVLISLETGTLQVVPTPGWSPAIGIFAW